MIYRKAHIADCARYMGAVFPVVVAVSALVFLSQLLATTIASALPISSLWQFLSLTLIKYMPQLLTISVFAGIVLALARHFHNREMTVWFSSGIGLRHFTLPGVLFALPAVAVIAVSSCYISPWAVRAADELRARLLHDINPQVIRPGEFGTTPGGVYTYFINGDGSRADNIFIVRNNNHEAHEVISTRAARRDTDNGGGEFISLQHGIFYRLPNADQQSPEITSFDSMQIYLPSRQPSAQRTRGAKFSQLQWDNPKSRAELIWRFNQPLAALFFATLAPLLGGSAIRRHKPGRGFFVALFLFIIYLNLMYFMRDMMADDKLHFAVALFAPPLIVFAIALIFQMQRR
ncbi:MAG: LPS export ABC transporter permease LptF [Gammaproteobacteria bacterium WSBS_2016_MAG_OTU1]